MGEALEDYLEEAHVILVVYQLVMIKNIREN